MRRAAGEFKVVLFNRFYRWQSRLLQQCLPPLVASAIFTEQKLLQEVGIARFFFRGLLCQCGPISRETVEFELLAKRLDTQMLKAHGRTSSSA